MYEETAEPDVRILSKYLNSLISNDPIIGGIGVSKRIHSGGSTYKSEEKKIGIPLQGISAELSFEVEDVYTFKLERICLEIYNIANSIVEKMTQSMFSTMTQITDLTGNVIDAKGKQFNYEIFIEMLEKIHIGFDEDGKPLLPTILMHPDSAKNIEKLKAEEDKYKPIIEEIINKKREAYYAEKGCRRLSRIN